jgi:hypothetical protein
MARKRLIPRVGAAFFAALLLSRGAVAVHAQDVAGVLAGSVVDELTGDPLPGVTLSINGHDIRTTSDDDGLFELAPLPTGQLTLRVELSGYATVTEQIEVLPDEVGFFQLQLSPLAYALQGIVVRAWRDDPRAARTSSSPPRSISCGRRCPECWSARVREPGAASVSGARPRWAPPSPPSI